LSADPPRQRIALIALREAVQNNDDMIVDIIAVVASTTRDPSVVEEAARTLSKSRNPRVAQILRTISTSQNTPGNTQTSAYLGSQTVAVRAAMDQGSAAVRAAIDQGTAVFYATQPGGKAFEDESLRHGIFTFFLINAFSTEGRAITADKKL